jgi:hypothetical protein
VTQPEEWLPVVGYEGAYEVSDLGRVRSLDRIVIQATRGGGTAPHTYPGTIMGQHIGTAGYLDVTLCRSSRHKTWRVHTVVAEAFLGPRPEGLWILHGPLGPLVNTVANLRYGTPAENSADEIRDGTRRRGSRMAAAKLTEDLVLEARRRRSADGIPIKLLAAEYGVSESCMFQVLTGLTWRHVEAA